jgi:hypothetical protein
MEALAHLHSNTVESIINAQEAIARARSLQMHPATNKIGQIWATLNCIDLICSLSQFKWQEATEKLKIVQEAMDDLIVDKTSWTSDGSVAVPLGKRSSKRVSDFAGQIYTQDSEGAVALNFTWLSSIDAYAMSFLLSGSNALLKGPSEIKAGLYIQEGINIIEGLLQISLLRPHANRSSIFGANEYGYSSVHFVLEV